MLAHTGEDPPGMVDHRVAHEETGEDPEALGERIRTWLDSEGLSSKRVTEDENAQFHYVIQYPPGKGNANIHIVRPKGRSMIALTMGVQLSPQHLEPFKALDDADRRSLIHRLRRTAFQGGEVGFVGQAEDGVLARWQLDVAVYDDAVSQHALMAGLRKLYTKHLLLIENLNETLGDVAQGSASTTGEQLRGYL